ncbi:hypothetical protein [Dysgonomonas sp. 520]|uniref:hypothetical protein n=1 Tax=Dysgonomonas sp. 520 TaxID=2302931 RepID=UPI0013D70581|nr:hypothetical protein [Dysgonomonas sp. 520]NDW10438.1 hypothetical protein [Dysgonomonas sp. 520]
MRVERIGITTTDGQILIDVDGKNQPKGYPKNSLKYDAGNTYLNFYEVGKSEILYYTEWGNVTINGTIVTKDNANEALEPLFT